MAGKKPTRGVEGSEKVWGLEEIEQLIDALIERQVTEFELEQNGAKIRVKRGTCGAPTYAVARGACRSAGRTASGGRTPRPRNTRRIRGGPVHHEIPHRGHILRGPVA